MDVPKRIIIEAHPGKESAMETAFLLTDHFRSRGIAAVPTDESADLAIAIGGDGFMMRTVGRFSPRGISTLGINAGNIGFLTSVKSSEWERAAKRILTGAYEVERRVMLAARLNTQVFDAAFANDVVLHHPLSVAEYELRINGKRVYRVSGDGFIVATPTGSTGYGASVGGPIVQPGVQSLVLAPISPMDLNVRPFVVDARSVVDIRIVASKGSAPISVVGDGQVLASAGIGELIRVTQHSIPALFAILDRNGFFRALHTHKGLKR